MSPKAVAEAWVAWVLAGRAPGECRVGLITARAVVDVRHLRLACVERGVTRKLTRRMVEEAIRGNRDSGYERTIPSLFTHTWPENC